MRTRHTVLSRDASSVEFHIADASVFGCSIHSRLFLRVVYLSLLFALEL